MYNRGRRILNMADALSNYSQIKNAIDHLSLNEKIQLAHYLDDLTLLSEFKKFRKEMKDIPVSLEDITAEVEAVREARYNAGCHRH